jgi:hypothetical protein
MAEGRVRFIECSTEEYNNAQKLDNVLYFITSGELQGTLYKGLMLIGKDFTDELTALVDIVESLMETSMNGLTWKEF